MTLTVPAIKFTLQNVKNCVTNLSYTHYGYLYSIMHDHIQDTDYAGVFSKAVTLRYIKESNNDDGFENEELCIGIPNSVDDDLVDKLIEKIRSVLGLNSNAYTNFRRMFDFNNNKDSLVVKIGGLHNDIDIPQISFILNGSTIFEQVFTQINFNKLSKHQAPVKDEIIKVTMGKSSEEEEKETMSNSTRLYHFFGVCQDLALKSVDGVTKEELRKIINSLESEYKSL